MVGANVGGCDENSQTNDNWPLWRYVKKQGRTSEGGGNQSFKCLFCNKSFNGSYSRVKYHLLKESVRGISVCEKVKDDKLNEMRRLENEATYRKTTSRPKHVPLPCDQTIGMSASMPYVNREESHELKKKRKSGNAIEKAFKMKHREQLDEEIARMFYSAGIPFNLARNPYFIRAFSFATNHSIAGYVPPGYNALRTTLLQKERSNIENLLGSTKSTWRDKGVSLVCDGLTDPQRRPLVNFMAVNENGPVFIHAVNCLGDYKDKYYIFNLIKDVIEKVGIANVVQVITDNAPVCRAAGLLVEQTYPHIFWTPCVVHTLNLALKNICAAKNTEANGITYEECHWITEVVAGALMIRNFIMNHSMRLSLFNEFSKIKLLAVAETRFASMIVMLKRFQLIKNQLQYMVISEKWSSYRDDDIVKARIVKERLLDDAWWESVEYILSFTEPIYSMLRFCDTDKPCLHLVHEMWDTMIFKVRKIIYQHEKKSDVEDSRFWNIVRKVLEDRWNKSNTPLHCLAHSLNPRCTTHLTPPRRDLEISNMRKACLRRLFPDETARLKVNKELANFFACLDHFSDEDSIRDRWEMDPLQWWVIHGESAPLLQSVSEKLLGQVCSSSCCERNWSTYAFIHSTKRNKITPKRAEDLVFVHSNLRLLSRKTPEYMQGESKLWDVAGDAFESLDDVGILGIADLSLDEPDFEAVLFADEVNETQDGDPVDLSE